VVLEEALGHALAHAQAGEDLHGYVLLLDLDGFKPVNDTHGHAAGDVLLQTVAQRLQACLRSTDTVTRLGGDEFVIVAQGKGPHPAGPVAGQGDGGRGSPGGLPGPGAAGGRQHRCRALPEAGRSSAELLVRADQAMYAAKQAKRLAR
jgi:GGDEF domain-containing protein